VLAFNQLFAEDCSAALDFLYVLFAADFDSPVELLVYNVFQFMGGVSVLIGFYEP
jgi:hypothetical protein